MLEAFTARIHRDKTIDECRLSRCIRDGIERRHDPAYYDKPLCWYSATLAEWVERSRNGALHPLPPYKPL